MLDAIKTCDRKRLLCLHVRAYAAAATTYQLCFRDVSNEKRVATKSDRVERKRERERERERETSKRKMRDISDKRKRTHIYLNLIFSIHLPCSSITFNSFLINLLLTFTYRTYLNILVLYLQF